MDVKKKIIFIVPSMRGGGSERVISTLVNNLDRSKFDITLALLQKEGKYLDDLLSDIDIVNLEAKQARFAILKIRNMIRDRKPDIVFSTLGHLNLLIAIIMPILSKNIKYIARESSIVSINNKQGKYPKLFNFLYKKFYNNFDLIIAQSNYMKNDLMQNYSMQEKKIKLINNPVDIDKISKLAQTNDVLFNKNNINLIAVGRLGSEKGFDLLLEAFSKLDNSYHLYFIGDGDEKNNLLNILERFKLSNRVHFLGFQSNPYKYMAQADLMVLSSRYEGFPNVVLEANACGTPVVAFNCPGGTGEIIEDGVNGTLVKCGDVDALVKTIKYSVARVWSKQTIKYLIQNKYSLQNIITKYENEFNK